MGKERWERGVVWMRDGDEAGVAMAMAALIKARGAMEVTHDLDSRRAVRLGHTRPIAEPMHAP
jgi:hypothetical protein